MGGGFGRGTCFFNEKYLTYFLLFVECRTLQILFLFNFYKERGFDFFFMTSGGGWDCPDQISYEKRVNSFRFMREVME